MYAIDHTGKRWKSKKEMCNHYKVTVQYYTKKIKEGASVQEALKAKIYMDHLGNKYPSDKEMCEHYNIPHNVYIQRVNKLHWGIKRALLQPVRKRNKNHGLIHWIKYGVD